MLGGWKLVVGCYLLPDVVVNRLWLIGSGVGWWSIVGCRSFKVGCYGLVIVGCWSKVGWLLEVGGWLLLVVVGGG